ncbi:response regulator [Pseudomonas sp. Marseille-QA0892]
MVVVIVDDDKDIRQLICDALEIRNYESTTFETADDAWRYLTSGRVPVDLLITDVRMPGELDGFDLARLATEQLGLPTIVASGYCDETKYSSHTPEVFLHKPWSLDALLTACDVALGQAPNRTQ